jgi:hypothetical protein
MGVEALVMLTVVPFVTTVPVVIFPVSLSVMFCAVTEFIAVYGMETKDKYAAKISIKICTLFIGVQPQLRF